MTKKLYNLHAAYNKHAPRLLGRLPKQNWGLYYCPCGIFTFTKTDAGDPGNLWCRLAVNHKAAIRRLLAKHPAKIRKDFETQLALSIKADLNTGKLQALMLKHAHTH